MILPRKTQRNLSWWRHERYAFRSTAHGKSAIVVSADRLPAQAHMRPANSQLRSVHRKFVRTSFWETTMWRHLILLAVVGLFASSEAGAVLTRLDAEDDTMLCDPLQNVPLTHELGGPGFPIDELIDVDAEPTTMSTCGAAFGGQDHLLVNNWRVTITNLSPHAWTALHFVKDPNVDGVRLGNPDGRINGAYAFEIDIAGVNVTLLGGDAGILTVFEPGEAWTFLVVDHIPFPMFASIGVPSPLMVGSNASIVARCVDRDDEGDFAGLGALQIAQCPINVPEPSGLPLMALGLAALLPARRAKRKWLPSFSSAS